MTTAATAQRVRKKSGRTREFSLWHERSMEQLLTGAGLSVRREPLIGAKTPDLLVETPDAGVFVVECIARLPDPGHAEEMERTGLHVCDGDIACLRANVYSRLQEKATKYRGIAQEMPYVIALYDGTCMNSVQTAIDMTMSPYEPTLERGSDGSVRNRRYEKVWPSQQEPGALFELYPHLSGLIYSRWPREHHYLPNQKAIRPVDPELLPFASVPPLPPHYRQELWTPKDATMPDESPEPPEEWLRQLRNTSNTALHQMYRT